MISFGFWSGDENFREPDFYSHTSPEPEGLAAEPQAPPSARWVEQRGSHLAILGYLDVREVPDPHRAVLEIYESAYRAGRG